MLRSLQQIPNIKLIFFYLIISFPTLIFLVFVTGPFQVSDEPAHFLRAVQLSHGHVMPVLAPDANAAGGLVDSSAHRLVDRLGNTAIYSDPHHRFLLSDLATPPDESSPGGLDFAVFSNTVIYFPIAHAVPALAILIARHAGTTPIEWFYAGRLANAFLAILISALAIAMLDEGALFALVFATLPMALFEEASLSADAAVIPFSILFVALLCRIAGTRPLTWSFYGLLFVTLLYVAVGKVAYVALSVLPPVIAVLNRRRSSASIGLAAMTIVMVASWAVWAKLVHNDVFTIRPDHVYVNVNDQMRFVLGHPVHFILALIRTWYAHGILNIEQVVGAELGWVALNPPKLVVLLMLASLILATVLKLHNPVLQRPSKMVILACLGFSFLLIYAFIYLQDTPVGHNLIDGVQGRYFLPLVAFAPVVIPGKRVSEKRYRQLCISLFAFQVIGATTTGILVWHSYWT